MDDFNISALHESKNEWGARLLTMLTPLIVEGLRSIFQEAHHLCEENRELDKYLMTFQNFLTRIPKWNPAIIEAERKRIIERSGCAYLEELVTCIHIIQLKLLTAMRVGQKQKKVDINIPSLDDFLHKVYIHVGRKVYKNVYLFEVGIPKLQIQKYNRELELLVQESILGAVRESIPVESILRAYLDETVEEDVVEEIKEEILPPAATAPKDSVPAATSVPVAALTETKVETPLESVMTELKKESIGIRFNDIDLAVGNNGIEEKIEAPKTIERLEEISVMRNQQRKLEEEAEAAAEDSEKIKILDEPLNLSLDIQSIDLNGGTNAESGPSIDSLLGEIEVL